MFASQHTLLIHTQIINHMNKLRKIIQKTGFDIHRVRKGASKMDYLMHLNINTVLDIGANEGQFATEIRNILPQAHIYSFEPLKECFAHLQKKFVDDKKFTAFNIALGAHTEEVSMHKNMYTPSSSILEMADTHKELFPHTAQSQKEVIYIKRLDDHINDIQLHPDILIKVDVQGFEDKVIQGGMSTFKKARAILIETSFVTLYSNQPLFADIYNILTDLGFTYQGSLQEKINTQTGAIISEDSLFLRKN